MQPRLRCHPSEPRASAVAMVGARMILQINHPGAVMRLEDLLLRGWVQVWQEENAQPSKEMSMHTSNGVADPPIRQQILAAWNRGWKSGFITGFWIGAATAAVVLRLAIYLLSGS